MFVAAGSSVWQNTKNWPRERRLFALAPPGEDPANFDWGCLAGSNPVLLAAFGELDGAFLHRLVAAMFRDGVGRVLDMRSGIRYVPAPKQEVAV